MFTTTKASIPLFVSWLVVGCTPSLPPSTPSTPDSHMNAIRIIDFGAIPDDEMDDTAAVKAAIHSATTSNTKTLSFSGGKFNLSNLTFPRTLSIVVSNGTLLELQNDATIQFEGPFTAGLYQVFSGNGNAQFASGAVSEVYPQWWGASPYLADSSPAINQAINSSPLLPGVSVRLTVKPPFMLIDTE